MPRAISKNSPAIAPKTLPASPRAAGGNLSMLDYCWQLAARLQRYRWLAWCLAAAACCGLVMGVFVFTGPASQSLTLMAICALLWSLTGIGFLQAFTQPLAQPDPGAGWWRRQKIRLARLYRWSLAILVAGLLVALLWFSGRSLLLVMGQ